MKYLPLLLLAGCSWLQSTQGQAVEPVATNVAVCVLNHVTEPIPQIISDCDKSLTVDQVSKIVDAHNAARDRARDGGP